MREIRTSGLMSGEGKRGDWQSLQPPRPSSTLQPRVTPALFTGSGRKPICATYNAVTYSTKSDSCYGDREIADCLCYRRRDILLILQRYLLASHRHSAYNHLRGICLYLRCRVRNAKIG